MKNKGEANTEQTAAKKKTLNPFKNKKLKYGSISVLFTVIFIAAVVLVNIIITMLGERFAVSADLTDAGLFTIEQSSADYLKGITDKVTITVTTDESEFSGAGKEFNQTNEILKRIANCNDGISLEYIDVVSNPGFAAKYPDEKITSGEIVVASEGTGRAKVLSYEDYFAITYNEQYLQYYGQKVPQKIEANCEQAVLSAIMNVTDTDPVKVAVITGYGETENGVVKSLLETNSYVIETVNITLVDEISGDYDFVFIFGPDKDYLKRDIDKLDKWLDNNGDFGKNMIYVANPKLGDSPMLDGLLADWGLTVGKGTLYQTDTNYARETLQLLDIPETEFTKFTNTDATVQADNISPVTPLWEGYGNMTTQIVAQTYNGAVIKPQNSGDNWKPENGAEKKAYGAVVQSMKTRFEGVNPFISRIVAVGSMEMFSNEFFVSKTNNAQLLLNIFNVSCNKEAGISLTPKSYDVTALEITDANKNSLVIAFVCVLPALLLIFGIVIWVRRIHK